jgi:hypothetical protein
MNRHFGKFSKLFPHFAMLSYLSNNHFRDGYIITSLAMTGLSIDPDITYPGG